MTQIRSHQTELQKYIQLTQILARNERLFYQLLMKYTEELMPIVYTPTVGQACQEYGLIFRDPRYTYILVWLIFFTLFLDNFAERYQFL